MRYIKSYKIFESENIENEERFTIKVNKTDNTRGTIDLKDSTDISVGGTRYEIIPNYKENTDNKILNKKVFFLSALEVEKHKGLGSKFMPLLIEHAKKIKCDVIVLDVSRDNDKAMKYYNKFGFVEVDDNAKSHYSIRMYKEL